MTFQNKKRRSKFFFLEPIIALFGCFVPKSEQKCDRTLHTPKRAARTHIAHTVAKPFPHALLHAHRTCESAIIRTCAPQPNIWM